MKQFLLTCFAVVSSFTAMAQTDVQPIVAKYSGDLYIALNEEEYSEDARMSATVLVDANNEAGKVDFSLPNFSFASMPLGDIFLPNIEVKENEGVYTFGENPDVRFNFLDGEIVADAHLDYTRSYVKGDSIVAYIPVQWVQESGNTPIYVLFKGKVQSPYDLTNGNFNSESDWKQSTPWDSQHGYFDWSALEGNDEYWDSAKWQQDEYITPSPWCISNVIGMNGLGATLVGEPTQVNDEEAEVADYAVMLINRPNPFMSTQIVPGYMSLGTTWATASVMNLTNSADGGTFGGVAFTGKPDAIQFDYARIHGKAKAEGESSDDDDDEEETYDPATLNAEEPATVVAYLWKGQYQQANVPGETALGAPKAVTMYGRDRNILDLKTTTGGQVTCSEDAACVAKVVKSITGDQTESLKTMTVELDYGQYAGTDIQPDSLNIIFSASDYFGDRSKVGAGNALIVDNVKLLYYHELRDITYDCKLVEFSADRKADLSSISYSEDKPLSYIKVGEGATVTKAYDAETGVLTLSVAAQDAKYREDGVTTYTIQFSTVPAGINNVETSGNNQQTIYTIDGRRVNAMTKGVYVVNGKKVVK